MSSIDFVWESVRVVLYRIERAEAGLVDRGGYFCIADWWGPWKAGDLDGNEEMIRDGSCRYSALSLAD